MSCKWLLAYNESFFSIWMYFGRRPQVPTSALKKDWAGVIFYLSPMRVIYIMAVAHIHFALILLFMPLAHI